MLKNDFSKSPHIIEETNWRIVEILDLPSEEEFVTFFNNLRCIYSHNGNSICPKGKKLFKQVLNDIRNGIDDGKYIWTDIAELSLFNEIKSMFGIPETHRTIRTSKLFLGDIGTGSHLHYHSPVCNFLISGKKKWIIFPNNEYNANIIKEELNFKRRKPQELSVGDWIEKNDDFLKTKIQGLEIIIQEARTVFFLPNDVFHIVLNLELTMGITCSWY